jgi:zinc protease
MPSVEWKDGHRRMTKPHSLSLATTVAATVLLLAPAAAAQAPLPSKIGPIVERRLANGMSVVLQEDHRAPLVSLRIAYEGGESAAPAALAGVSRLTTSLMINATKHVHPGEYADFLARAGATGVTDWTSVSGTQLAVTVPVSQLALPLWLWSDQVAFFDDGVDDAQFVTQRNHLLVALRAGAVGSPTSRLDEFAWEELIPPDSPLHAFVTAETVAGIDRAAVLAFHARWITPAHATLAMVGDFAAADALALVERYFGPIPRGNADHTAIPPTVTLRGETQVDVAADVPAAEVSLRWPTPRLLTSEDARLDDVAHLLVSVRTSWLYWKLVDEKKVATNVTARQRSGDLASQFDVHIIGAPGRSAVEVLAAYDAAMDELRSRPVGPGELRGASYETLIDHDHALENPWTRASDYAKYARLVGTADYEAHDFERYSRLTPAQVREAMDRWLPRDRRVVLLVTPTPGAPPGGERRGAPRFTPARTP